MAREGSHGSKRREPCALQSDSCTDLRGKLLFTESEQTRDQEPTPWADEMLVAKDACGQIKPDDQRLIPRNHISEGEKQLYSLSSGLQIDFLASVPHPHYKQIHREKSSGL